MPIRKETDGIFVPFTGNSTIGSDFIKRSRDARADGWLFQRRDFSEILKITLNSVLFKFQAQILCFYFPLAFRNQCGTYSAKIKFGLVLLRLCRFCAGVLSVEILNSMVNQLACTSRLLHWIPYPRRYWITLREILSEDFVLHQMLRT